MIIKGHVEGMRPVAGIFQEGKKAGQEWHFLSLEVKDGTTGKVCSVQMRHDCKQYVEFIERKEGDKDGKLIKDYTGHNVKMRVGDFNIGEMSKFEQQVIGTPQPVQPIQSGEAERRQKSIGYVPIPVLVVRFRATRIDDLGEPSMDDE